MTMPTDHAQSNTYQSTQKTMATSNMQNPRAMLAIKNSSQPMTTTSGSVVSPLAANQTNDKRVIKLDRDLNSGRGAQTAYGGADIMSNGILSGNGEDGHDYQWDDQLEDL